MKKILILEDEPHISDFVAINLQRAGYETVIAVTGEEAVAVLEAQTDIIVALLDVGLPGEIDGFEVCRRIRKMGRVMGIIILTARAEEMDKVQGLMIGADDYITKPLESLSVLTARVDALVRRVLMAQPLPSVIDTPLLESGEFSIDTRSRTFCASGQPLDLTQVEYLIMKFLMENKNKALSRGEILTAVWGSEYVGELKVVDVNVRRLRVKIEKDPANPEHLLTVWGYGYKWI